MQKQLVDWVVTSLTKEKEFIQKLNFSDPLIIAVVSFHAICLLAMLINRRKETFIFVSLSSLVGLSLLTDQLNVYANLFWKQMFAKQNYFADSEFIVGLVGRPASMLAAFGFLLILVDLVQSFVEFFKAPSASPQASSTTPAKPSTPAATTVAASGKEKEKSRPKKD